VTSGFSLRGPVRLNVECSSQPCPDEGAHLERLDLDILRTSRRGGRQNRHHCQTGNPTGHLVFAAGTTLFAAPFDPVQARLTGARVPMVEGVRREVWGQGNTAAANYGFTNDGVLESVSLDPVTEEE
jgi:hypothetical protein